MFGKVKKWLGIEGVKIEILLPEEVRARDRVVEGKLRFQSMNTQTVTNVNVAIFEKYSRGRGAEKLIDEYKLGEIALTEAFEVPEGEIVEVDFELPFQLVKSEMDEFADRNFLFRGVANLAKTANAVKSYYRVEATAKVKGTALNPFDSKPLHLK
ncbi:MAG: sporulation protein [Saprospiraceae bacterium]